MAEPELKVGALVAFVGFEGLENLGINPKVGDVGKITTVYPESMYPYNVDFGLPHRIGVAFWTMVTAKEVRVVEEEDDD